MTDDQRSGSTPTADSGGTAPEDLRVVVVGGGLAAGATTVTLREEGHRGPLTVLTAEAHPPYERPALSKGYLAGDEQVDGLLVQPLSWYAEHDVDLRLGTEVTALDRERRVVTTADGAEVPYDRLVLATGARPRRLPAADAVAGEVPVRYLRTLEDADRLRDDLGPGRRVVVVGGGFLGLEVAATARTRGADVALVESRPLPLAGVLGEQVGERFAALHRAHGVELHLGAQVAGVRADGGRVVVDLEGGAQVTGDVLVVGVGAEPVTDLAEAAGLEVDDGVVVDEHLVSSDPHVLAAGDVARFRHQDLDRHLRVEHWATAKEHGRVAALAVLGRDRGQEKLPYFFTDQYDLGMEHFGDVGPDGFDDLVVRGDLAGGPFQAYYARAGVVRAALQVDDWDASDQVRSAVYAGAPVDEVRPA